MYALISFEQLELAPGEGPHAILLAVLLREICEQQAANHAERQRVGSALPRGLLLHGDGGSCGVELGSLCLGSGGGGVDILVGDGGGAEVY